VLSDNDIITIGDLTTLYPGHFELEVEENSLVCDASLDWLKTVPSAFRLTMGTSECASMYN